ncbi:MAG: hypothetical protein AAF289_12335 [Cyanobacteria bacterium P01_A01_bin.135]
MFLLLISLFVAGWVAVAVIGTQAYYRGEQVKPIHERNWNSQEFETVAQIVTGTETNFAQRVPAYSGDAYSSANLNS